MPENGWPQTHRKMPFASKLYTGLFVWHAGLHSRFPDSAAGKGPSEERSSGTSPSDESSGAWDEFCMAESATTINENGVRWQYAVPRRVVQRSSTLLALRARG